MHLETQPLKKASNTPRTTVTEANNTVNMAKNEFSQYTA